MPVENTSGDADDDADRRHDVGDTDGGRRPSGPASVRMRPSRTRNQAQAALITAADRTDAEAQHAAPRAAADSKKPTVGLAQDRAGRHRRSARLRPRPTGTRPWCARRGGSRRPAARRCGGPTKAAMAVATLTMLSSASDKQRHAARQRVGAELDPEHDDADRDAAEGNALQSDPSGALPTHLLPCDAGRDFRAEQAGAMEPRTAEPRPGVPRIRRPHRRARWRPDAAQDHHRHRSRPGRRRRHPAGAGVAGDLDVLGVVAVGRQRAAVATRAATPARSWSCRAARTCPSTPAALGR